MKLNPNLKDIPDATLVTIFPARILKIFPYPSARKLFYAPSLILLKIFGNLDS